MKLHLPPLLFTALVACLAATTLHRSISGSSSTGARGSSISFRTEQQKTNTQEQAADNVVVYNYTQQPTPASSFSIHATTAELEQQTEAPQQLITYQVSNKTTQSKTTAANNTQKAVTTNAVAGVFNSINEADTTPIFESAGTENAGIALAAEDGEIAVAAIDTTGYQDVEGTAAIYLKNGAASGNTTATRTGRKNYTYTITNLGSYLNANLGTFTNITTTYWRGSTDYTSYG